MALRRYMYLVGFVTEKVNLGKIFMFQVVQTISLIPALHSNNKNQPPPSQNDKKSKSWSGYGGEDVERDLAANGIGEPEIGKAALQLLYHTTANLMLMIVLFKLVSFLLRTVATNWRNVNHAIAELDKSSPFNRNLQISDMLQYEVYELLILWFANPLDETLRGNQLAVLECIQSVLGKCIVKQVDAVLTKLLQLFLQIRTTDKPNDTVLFELFQRLQHVGGNLLSGRCQSSVHVKKTNLNRLHNRQ